MRKKEILEYIQEQEGSLYISDLRGRKIHWFRMISGMDLSMFSLKEWEAAIVYITGERQLLNNYADLWNWLER